jgi:hypothetical protein
VKRAIFLATAALLVMLVLAPMAWTQGGTTMDDKELSRLRTPPNAMDAGGSGSTVGSLSPPLTPLEDTGGPAILLPAAALLLGSGILTYAILRRR